MQAIEASIAEEPRDLPFALVYMIEELSAEAVRCAVSPAWPEDDPLGPRAAPRSTIGRRPRGP